MLFAWILVVLVMSPRSQGAGEDQRSPRVVIQPQLAQRNAGDSLTVLCKIALPIQACQFKVRWETDTTMSELPPWDFGNGSSSVPGQGVSKGGVLLFNAAYHGAGFGLGECGMTLTNLKAGRYFVGCRVQSGDVGWLDDYMALVVHTKRISIIVESSKAVDSFIRHDITLQRPSPTIWFAANDTAPLVECKFFLPHQPDPVILNTTGNTISSDKHQVFLQGNKCGVTLLSPNNASNGVLWCLYRVSTDYKLFAPEIVAVTKSPTVSLNATLGNLTVGDEFTATCAAASARPPAKISWTLDGHKVREDALDDDVTHPWTWPWELHSVTQVLKHTLSREELGKKVTCHVTQPGGEEVKRMSVVRWDPSVCIDGFVVCNWMVVLAVVAVVVLVIASIAGVVYTRRRRDWRWS